MTEVATCSIYILLHFHLKNAFAVDCNNAFVSILCLLSSLVDYNKGSEARKFFSLSLHTGLKHLDQVHV